MPLAVLSVFPSPWDTSQPEQLLGARPALRSQRASVVTERASQGVNCHLVSFPESVKSFLSQLYKNTSLQIGRTLPWHYISLKKLFHNLEWPTFLFTASLCEEQRLLLSTRANWSSKRGSDLPRAIPSWLRKSDLLLGLDQQAWLLWTRKGHILFPVLT